MDRPRLLVIDDDIYTRNALHCLFTPRGWQVGLAGTVAEGLDRLDPAPDCIILDLNLPDGGGEQILREVRLHHPRTRVAVCSGTDDARLIREVQELRPEILLWKPIDLAPIFRLCDSIFARTA